MNPKVNHGLFAAIGTAVSGAPKTLATESLRMTLKATKHPDAKRSDEYVGSIKHEDGSHTHVFNFGDASGSGDRGTHITSDGHHMPFSVDDGWGGDTLSGLQVHHSAATDTHRAKIADAINGAYDVAHPARFDIRGSK